MTRVAIKIILSVLTLTIGPLACAEGESPTEPSSSPSTIEEPSADRAVYEPMQVFAKLAGQTMRGEWVDDDGETIVDINYGEMILDGRGYQGTHKIQNSSYGGRTIIFYDEGAKEYIYHYFTTGGFHTTGKIEPTEYGYSATEQVNGHPSIQAVSSTLTVQGETHIITVKYQTHEGEWSDAPLRTYKPHIGPRPFAE